MMKPTFVIVGMLVIAAGCSASPDEPRLSAPPATGATIDNATRADTGATRADAVAEKVSSVAADQRELPLQPKLALDPEGLRWFLPPNGTARPLPFGTAQADVLASLEPSRGEAAEGTNADCGAGPVQYANWADGISLVFQNGRFSGWSLDGRARDGITTADGIGIGTTRGELDAAIGPPLVVRRTSLGAEFTAGAYHGLFDSTKPDARIKDMWAGISCVAR